MLGTHGVNWKTKDCGATFSALNASSKPIHEIIFHPEFGQWALGASWVAYEQLKDEPERIYKELYYTKDMGETW